MALFPNATRGYMPFVHGKNGTIQTKNNKRSKLHVNGGKLHKVENRKHTPANLGPGQKLYQVTLKDKKGQTYKCIVKSDGTKSLPELCESKLGAIQSHLSMPNIGTGYNSPSKQRKILAEKVDALNALDGSGENFSTSLDLRNCGKKEGLFSALIRFIKEKTGKSEKDTSKKSNTKHKSNSKSKRKPKDLSQRKRQRTVSAMSNLDPIQESPFEHVYEEDDDNDSYSHFSSSWSDSDTSSVSSGYITCNINAVDSKSS